MRQAPFLIRLRDDHLSGVGVLLIQRRISPMERISTALAV
jgi:hypothetical protein